MKFEFTLDEINIIMASLGKAPYESVFQVIDKIKEQAQPQLAEAQAAQKKTESAE
jgi:hypothetical protein